MNHRFRQYRAIGRATFPLHQRGLDIVGISSIVMLVGVSLTGIWQFFAHRSNPDWFGYVPDAGFSGAAQPAAGVAEAHSLFGTGAGIVALVGTGWFAYRIAHRVPVACVVAFVCIVFAGLTDALVRFNLIHFPGVAFDEVGPGYLQVFTNEVDYVVTDVGQTEAGPFRLLVVAHIATVPILVGFAWWTIIRALERQTQAIANAPKRTWFTGPDIDQS